jgi:hypothetical protein
MRRRGRRFYRRLRGEPPAYLLLFGIIELYAHVLEQCRKTLVRRVCRDPVTGALKLGDPSAQLDLQFALASLQSAHACREHCVFEST